MFATKTAENPAHSYESEASPRDFLAGAQLRSPHLEVAHLVSENERVNEVPPVGQVILPARYPVRKLPEEPYGA